MGGGDLNMKKSFHPNTMQNLERVWKAEQKRDQEKKKIDQLRRELQEERAREEMHQHAIDTGVIKDRGKRLDWMYSGPGAQVNHEEYLLGKKIDKAVDPFAAQAEAEASSSSAPGSLFASSSSSSASTTVDLAAKIKADPLFLMKKQEEQARKNLLKNPVRLKQLQDMLREQTGSGKAHKSEKKKKKKKKHHREESPERAGRSRSRSPLSRRKEGHRVRSRSPRTRSPRRRSPRGRSPNRWSRRSPSPHRRSRSPRGRSPRRRYHHSPSPRRRSPRNPSPPRRRSPHNRSPRRRSPRRDSPQRQSSPPRSTSYARPKHHSPRKRADPEELERRRQQMMADARSHDEERVDRIRRRRVQAEQEERELRAREKSTDEQFMAPLRANAFEKAAASTVEDRIHRNIHNLQRTKASLDKNFTAR